MQYTQLIQMHFNVTNGYLFSTHMCKMCANVCECPYNKKVIKQPNGGKPVLIKGLQLVVNQSQRFRLNSVSLPVECDILPLTHIKFSFTHYWSPLFVSFSGILVSLMRFLWILLHVNK